MIHRRSLLSLLPGLAGSAAMPFLAGCATGSAGCATAEAVTLPVSLRRGCPFVPVRINGRSVMMLLDTGAETTVVTPEGAALLELPPVPGLSTNGYGLGGSNLSSAVMLDRFEFGPVRQTKGSAWVVPVPIFSELRFPSKRPAVGILGGQSLAQVAVEIDAPRLRATFHPLTACASTAPEWAMDAYRLQAIDDPLLNRLWLPSSVDGMAVNALVDTGTTLTSMSLANFRRLGLEQSLLDLAPGRETVGAGGSRRVELRRLRFNELVMGEMRIAMPQISVRLSEDDGQPGMLIGMDILGRQPIWLAMAQKRLLIARTPSSQPLIAANFTA